MWIDAHSHLADARWDEDLDEVVARARDAGVSGWVQGGVSPAEWDRQRRLRDRLGEGVILAFGLHPWWVAAATDAALDEALKALERVLPEASLLGETGLDLAPRRGDDPAGRERQRRAFNAQLSLAKAAGKPLVLHVVRAHPEAARLLRAAGPAHRGLVHGFSGDQPAAASYLDLGLDLSIGPSLSKPGFHRLKEALPQLPPDRLLAETDDAAPHLLIQVGEALAARLGGTRESWLDRSTRRLRALLETPP